MLVGIEFEYCRLPFLPPNNLTQMTCSCSPVLEYADDVPYTTSSLNLIIIKYKYGIVPLLQGIQS